MSNTTSTKKQAPKTQTQRDIFYNDNFETKLAGGPREHFDQWQEDMRKREIKRGNLKLFLKKWKQAGVLESLQEVRSTVTFPGDDSKTAEQTHFAFEAKRHIMPSPYPCFATAIDFSPSLEVTEALQEEWEAIKESFLGRPSKFDAVKNKNHRHGFAMAKTLGLKKIEIADPDYPNDTGAVLGVNPDFEPKDLLDVFDGFVANGFRVASVAFKTGGTNRTRSGNARGKVSIRFCAVPEFIEEDRKLFENYTEMARDFLSHIVKDLDDMLLDSYEQAHNPGDQVACLKASAFANIFAPRGQDDVDEKAEEADIRTYLVLSVFSATTTKVKADKGAIELKLEYPAGQPLAEPEKPAPNCHVCGKKATLVEGKYLCLRNGCSNFKGEVQVEAQEEQQPKAEKTSTKVKPKRQPKTKSKRSNKEGKKGDRSQEAKPQQQTSRPAEPQKAKPEQKKQEPKAEPQEVKQEAPNCNCCGEQARFKQSAGIHICANPDCGEFGQEVKVSEPETHAEPEKKEPKANGQSSDAKVEPAKQQPVVPKKSRRPSRRPSK